MLRPQGYVTVFGAWGGVMEYDSITCAHCQRIVHVKPNTLSRVYLFPQMDGSMKEEPGAWCAKCDKAVCLRCHDIGVCRPIEKYLEFLEAVERGVRR